MSASTIWRQILKLEATAADGSEQAEDEIRARIRELDAQFLRELAAQKCLTASETPEVPARVTIRSRYRDLNARGKGSETYRLYCDLQNGTAHWIDQHPDAVTVHDGWCKSGIRASERRCSTKVEVPVGLLIIDIEKSVPGGQTSYTVGWTDARKDELRTDGGAIDWEGAVSGRKVQHNGVKKNGAGFVHVITINGKRREFASA